ncbi:diguanylate cyclase [Actinoplanes subtropicus]|uniref:diguanylate cyclase n=1 Tax=Actinoplanes subtropicus TaxID=543632 RepID=UPI00068A96B6|nr:diguanylate cyclase [Actinoplanes subtropicus]
MKRTGLRWISFLFAALGVLTAVLGTAVAASRASTERAQLDRNLVTAAGEKAALVDTELERMRALARVTSRIPPFSEFYADAGSQAAAIAAVAGPGREINNALMYLWQLYPDRIVEAGYVDVDGAENARVVDGKPVPAARLSHDVRSWPSYWQGIGTPVDSALISEPFRSPTADVPVVAVTVPVAVDGRVRAYIELELSTAALGRVLAADRDSALALQVGLVDGTAVTSAGPHVPALPTTAGAGLVTARHWRYAVREVPDAPGWYVVAAARPRSTVQLAVQPTQAALLGLAVLMLAAALVGFRRYRKSAAQEFAAEQQARAEAEQRSRVDALTGLFNRRHAMETIEHELARGSTGPGLGVLMVDVDHFKRVNDRYGHSGGDTVLVAVAERLRTGVREWDVVARIGGEEFCVVAPGLDHEGALAELGERLRLAIAERPVTLPGGALVPVTISIGAAMVAHDDGSAEHALDFADRALYSAKRQGRNRLRTFSQLGSADLRAEQPECLHIAEALAISSDLREGNLGAHSRQVADLSAAVARRLGLADEDVLRVQLGGWLHDVGKIAVPDAVLVKPGPLTDAERCTVGTHSAVGADLLRHFPELAPACAAVRHHHERFDGTGYPDGLAGDQIPLDARIVAAADAYSAMTADRPYRSPRTTAEAIGELRDSAGTQLDPVVVAALVEELEANPATPAPHRATV